MTEVTIAPRIFARAGLLAVVGFFALTSTTTAHLWERHGNSRDWYFYGAIFGKMPPTKEHRSDPVNLIFYRGRGHKSPAIVGSHISNEWRYGAMRSRFCGSNERMVWRDLRGGRISDKQDLHRMTSCNHAYHFRGWDDYEHSKITVHNRYQWVVGGIHHEHIVVTTHCFGAPAPICITSFNHKIDRDWDTVRVQAVKAMSAHCSYRRWQYHPGAHHTFHGFTSSGWIARLSMRHVAAGCSGA